MLIKEGVDIKEDIAFLKKILKNIRSKNLHDQMEGKIMLRDQIAHMKIRKDKNTDKSGG